MWKKKKKGYVVPTWAVFLCQFRKDRSIYTDSLVSNIHLRGRRVRICSWRGVLDIACSDKVCQWLSTGRWVSPFTSVSSINKTDRHDITEILFKVALKTRLPPLSLVSFTNLQNMSGFQHVVGFIGCLFSYIKLTVLQGVWLHFMTSIIAVGFFG